MVHLAGLQYTPPTGAATDRYPFAIPVVRSLTEVKFASPVTMLVGENGSGKSTLLEALAVSVGAVTVGSDSVATDPTLAPARELAQHLRLNWKRRSHRGFFLRAEDFFNFCKRLAELRSELETDLAETDRKYAHRSRETLLRTRAVYAGSLSALTARYGDDLAAQSHGESFLRLFQSRIVPNGLYLLDEPETPLSPTRQLGLLSLMLEMVEQKCQFIVATHSPILLACPGAAIYSFDHSPPRLVAYDELEHVRITREFLSDPQRFLRHL